LWWGPIKQKAKDLPFSHITRISPLAQSLLSRLRFRLFSSFQYSSPLYRAQLILVPAADNLRASSPHSWAGWQMPCRASGAGWLAGVVEMLCSPRQFGIAQGQASVYGETDGALSVGPTD